NLFKKMNSIENSNLLNSFSLAKASLDQLRETKWVAEPAVLDSILFFYDLFSDFLKRQDAKTKFTIGQVLDITLANIDEFEYSGSEITPETITTARVKMPAWYLGEKLVTKAKIVEIKKQK
nr:hypothetical protein [Candidatus Sigynarchaeota archaeon]